MFVARDIVTETPRLYAVATGCVFDGKAVARLYLVEAVNSELARADALNQHQQTARSSPDSMVCVEATLASLYGKLKFFAVSTLAVSATGVAGVSVTLVSAHSREIADRDTRAAFKLRNGRDPDRIDIVEIPRPAPHPPMAEWLKAACIAPRVGAPLFAGVVNLLCEIDCERALPAEASFGEGPVARFYAGLAMIERAWHELPVHKPDDAYADAPDGH